jgi:hypothetical protein
VSTIRLETYGLFDLFVDRYFFEHRVVFLQFHTVRGILLVLGGDVPGHTGHPTGLVFGAFQNDLNAVTFFGHDRVEIKGLNVNWK